MKPMTDALTQAKDVYNRLLDDIASGELRPGERLREVALANRLKVSRTPVREALKDLEADGLVEHLPRVGASIKSLSYAEVVELYEMRAVLEGLAAKMAARSASDLELQALAKLNTQMAQAIDVPAQMAQLNRNFHRLLFNAAKNRYLLQAVSMVQKTLLVVGPSTLTEVSRASAVIEEHARVIEALMAREGAKAEAAMVAHIEASHRARLRQISEGIGAGTFHQGQLEHE
jgi:DNA-binding GntR family transcriptional regulator